MRAVILFDQVVEIFVLSEFTRSDTIPCCLQFLYGLWVGCIFVDGDDARYHWMGGSERFREKALCSLSGTPGA